MKEFENGGFTLKKRQTFCVHIMPKELQQPVAILDLHLGKNRSGKSHEHETENSAFANSSDLKGLFQKFRFRDDLVWTSVLTEETKLRV